MTNVLRSSMVPMLLVGLIACSVGRAERAVIAASGTVTSTGSMSTARAAHTATLLPNGKVLIAGGMGRNHLFFDSAELYDPATGKFTPTGSMTTKRVAPGAALLPSGKVLIVGGSNHEDGGLKSAELYDPATETFTATGSMKENCGLATLLADGRVLVVCGDKRAEVYDPRSGSFTLTGNPTWPTSDTATLLKTGKVLLIGGGGGGVSSSEAVFANAELYDPATGTFTPTGSMITARNRLAATLLPNGQVLVTGGSNEHGWQGQFIQAEIYDPTKGIFTATSNMNSMRFKHQGTMAVLPNGKVLIAGGAQSVEVYDPATGTFSIAAGGLDEARYFAKATLLQNGKILITGGYRRGTIVSTEGAWIYQS